MKYLHLLAAIVLVIGLGCKKKDRGFSKKERAEPTEAARPNQKAKKEAKRKVEDKDNQDDAVAVRKIKYTADLTVIVEDLDKAQKELDKRIAAIPKAYVAQSEINPSPGTRRHGFWKVRVPVERFKAFCEVVANLGEVKVNKSDSEDLTEEFYDLQARIKNQQAEEQSLRNLLVKTTKMEDHLVVRRALKELRVEIDRYQTRVKLIANLTDLTTVNVTLEEKQKYVPGKGPEASETPTLGMRISKTFEDSVEALSSFGQWLLLIIVGMAPWLPVLAVIVLPTWWFIRRSTHSVEALPVIMVPEPENSPPAKATDENHSSSRDVEGQEPG
jgi:hypothetical protein